MCYDLLESKHGGWENNEGGYGEFTFDVAAGTIVFDFNYRIERSENHYHELYGGDDGPLLSSRALVRAEMGRLGRGLSAAASVVRRVQGDNRRFQPSRAASSCRGHVHESGRAHRRTLANYA